MKNILVVSEFFTAGGLETQVLGQAEVLGTMGCRVHLATSSGPSAIAQEVFASCAFDVPMSHGRTARELLTAIDELRTICEIEKIDIIHAHPFLSMIVAGCVAHELCVPLVLTLHGPVSLGYVGADTTAGLMLASSIIPNASHVFAVSRETRLLCGMFTRRDIAILPNAVNVAPKDPPRGSLDLPWMWAGRLDSDKAVGLKSLIEFVAFNEGIKLEIFGQGPARAEIEAHIAEVDVSQRMFAFREWHDNLPSIMPEYGVVAGMGRVLLEGALANRVCLLVGYDGIKGFLTEAGAVRSSFWNLSGRGLRNIEEFELTAQIASIKADSQKFLLKDWVRRERNAELIWTQYLEIISSSYDFKDRRAIVFQELLEYAGDDSQDFWSSPAYFDYLKSSLMCMDGRG